MLGASWTGHQSVAGHFHYLNCHSYHLGITLTTEGYRLLMGGALLGQKMLSNLGFEPPTNMTAHMCFRGWDSPPHWQSCVFSVNDSEKFLDVHVRWKQLSSCWIFWWVTASCRFGHRDNTANAPQSSVSYEFWINSDSTSLVTWMLNYVDLALRCWVLNGEVGGIRGLILSELQVFARTVTK